MSIYLLGLNHSTAPVEVRERVALDSVTLAATLNRLAALYADTGDTNSAHQAHPSTCGLNEVVILSTCNRLEIYTRPDYVPAAKAILSDFLCHLSGLELQELAPHLYHLSDRQAAEHLMRVASGLDSMVLGEAQILGQISSAYHAAVTARTVGPVLSRLFTQAMHTGKRARSETDICHSGTSISHTAARLIRNHLGDLQSSQILVLGAGDMARVAVSALRSFGAEDFICMSRTFVNAQTLANEIGIDVKPWHHLIDSLVWADVVFAATGAPHTIIHVDEVSEALAHRNARPLTCVDIAVPRDIEPDVGRMPGVRVFDIDALQCVVDENMAQRQAAVPLVEEIVRQEMSRFVEDFGSWQIGPTIADLRSWAEDIASQEAARMIRRLATNDPQLTEAIRQLGQRIARKLIHPPTLWLRQQSTDGNGQVDANLVQQIFRLEDSEDGGEEWQ